MKVNFNTNFNHTYQQQNNINLVNPQKSDIAFGNLRINECGFTNEINTKKIKPFTNYIFNSLKNIYNEKCERVSVEINRALEQISSGKAITEDTQKIFKEKAAKIAQKENLSIEDMEKFKLEMIGSSQDEYVSLKFIKGIDTETGKETEIADLFDYNSGYRFLINNNQISGEQIVKGGQAFADTDNGAQTVMQKMINLVI